MAKAMSTKATGAALALEFAAVCAYRGATVCEPFGDFAPYDILLDVPGKGFYRVQVKSATLNAKGNYVFNCQPRTICVGASGKLSSKAGNYLPGQVDALVSKVGSDWYILDNVHLLPASVAINPSSPGKRAAAMNAWVRVGL